MFHVLLVEPNDDRCLSLWHAVVQTGGRITIADSVAGARGVLRDAVDLDLLITNAALPDGRGFLIAREAAARGIRFMVIDAHEDSFNIVDERGTAFRGTVSEAVDFLKFALQVRRWQRSTSVGKRALCTVAP